MCGICGFAWDDKGLIKKMMDIQSHRGPDQSGYYTDNDVSLGHLRLSIIDLSAKGKQPMGNENNDIHITYNGEIYNFQEIKGKLIEKGHKFSSNTDTEVVVHAYEEYGEKCVSLFNGMFAFAIWDSRKKEFFLARDRAGIKPLYYSIKNGKLIFASEMKAILLHPDINRDIDAGSLYNYLTFRYVPGSSTIFKEIKKLVPGSYAIADKKGIEVKKYWQYEIKAQNRKADFYSARIDEILSDAVEKRMISDVPLGAFLSGGLDSTYVLSLMTEISDKPVKTFSIGFENEGYDESRFSRFAAEHYETDHHEIFVEHDSFKLLPKILWHMDEPISDFASIPTYILSEFAKKKVSVVLTGEGADEIFGGYRKYRYLNLLKNYHKLTPYSVRDVLSRLAGKVDKSISFARAREFNASKTIEEFYLNLISFFTEKEKMQLCRERSSKGRHDIEIVKDFFSRRHITDSMMDLDFNTWLPEDVLMKVDKTSMAHALEARVPFLDYRLVELAGKIPSSLKIRYNNEKYILRKAMKRKVPRMIYKRKKHGFNVPVHDWLEKDLKDYIDIFLSKESVNSRKLFNHSYVEKLLNNFGKSKTYYSRQIWLLLNLEIWSRIYLDGRFEKRDLRLEQLG